MISVNYLQNILYFPFKVGMQSFHPDDVLHKCHATTTLQMLWRYITRKISGNYCWVRQQQSTYLPVGIEIDERQLSVC